MWKVIPKKLLFNLFIYLYSLLIITLSLVLSHYFVDSTFPYFGTFNNLVKISSITTIITIIIFYLTGKWFWKFVWNMPFVGGLLNKHVCPDLNGKWVGSVNSNYSEDGKNTVQEVDVDIKVDFFGFSMELGSQDSYQNSKVIQSDIYKDVRNRTFHVSYIFESKVTDPKETDDKVFHGASILDIKFDKNDSLILEGSYWTNRAGQRKLNTSGSIKLIKQK